MPSILHRTSPMECEDLRGTMLDAAAELIPCPSNLKDHLRTCVSCSDQFERLRRTMLLLDDGVRGFLLNSDAAHELIAAVKALAHNRKYVTQKASVRVTFPRAGTRSPLVDMRSKNSR